MKEIILILVVDEMIILCLQVPKETTRKLVSAKHIGKVKGYKSNIQK
jgi:hypothetical protein